MAKRRIANPVTVSSILPHVSIGFDAQRLSGPNIEGDTYA
jgi:hypothetical protein